MKSYWKHLDTVPDGYKFKIKGLNIWEFPWENTGEKILVKDPLYGKDHCLVVWEIHHRELKIRFAAGEFSNCMWGIYIERKNIFPFIK